MSDISHHEFEIEKLYLIGGRYFAALRSTCGPHTGYFGVKGDTLEVEIGGGVRIPFVIERERPSYGRYKAEPPPLTLRGIALLLRFCDGRTVKRNGSA